MNRPTPPPVPQPPPITGGAAPTHVHVHQYHEARPPSSLFKGCAIAIISANMLWLIPLLALIGFIAKLGGDDSPVYAVPIAIALFSFVVMKIATAGTRRANYANLQRERVVYHTPSPEIQAPTKPKVLTFADKQAELFSSLPDDAQTRHQHLIEKSNRLKQLASNVDDPETNAQLGPGLEKLQWFHLKFLLAREHLQTHTPSHLKQDLLTKLNAVRESLQAENLSDVARKSKQATLDMTEERLRNLENRQCRLTEIESDIERIESQLDLSLERAALQSSGGSTTFQLDLAERMVDSSELFGSSLPLVSDLDAHFQGSLDRPSLG